MSLIKTIVPTGQDKNCNILCFTGSWLNDDMENKQLAGFSVHCQDRTAASGKTMGGGLCLFVNNNWCTKSNFKEVSRFCSPEIEYLMISCGPHYLTRNFSSIFFIVVYLRQQTDAGTKTALNLLYKAISKEENALPSVCKQLLVAREFIAGKLKSIFTHFYQHVTSATRGKKTLDHLFSTHRDAYKALPCPPFGKSIHNSILLIPSYKQKLKQEVPVTRSKRKWSDDADATLQDCFAS